MFELCLCVCVCVWGVSEVCVCVCVCVWDVSGVDIKTIMWKNVLLQAIVIFHSFLTILISHIKLNYSMNLRILYTFVLIDLYYTYK